MLQDCFSLFHTKNKNNTRGAIRYFFLHEFCPLLIKGFPIVSKSWQVTPWFERFKCGPMKWNPQHEHLSQKWIINICQMTNFNTRSKNFKIFFCIKNDLMFLVFCTIWLLQSTQITIWQIFFIGDWS